MTLARHSTFLPLLAFIALSTTAYAAPYDLDLKELDRQNGAPAAKPEAPTPAQTEKSQGKPAKQNGQEAETNGKYMRYTVQPGDHIFKILMTRFGMSNAEAERLIPEIARINHISNIKALTVGQTLLIPRNGKPPKAANGAKVKR